MNTEKEKTNRKFMWKIKMRLRRLFYIEYSPRYIRFKGDLCTYKEYLHVMQINMNDDEKEKNWTTQALVLCEKAIDKLNERKIDEGWKMLHAAKRLEIYGNEFIRKAIIIELREEANKLNEWRKNSILKIIGFRDEKKDLDISPEELRKALKIRDEFYHALYYTNLLTRRQFNLLFLILALIIGLGLWYQLLRISRKMCDVCDECQKPDRHFTFWFARSNYQFDISFSQLAKQLPNS